MIRFLLFVFVTAITFPTFLVAQGGPPTDRYIVVLKSNVGPPADVAADIARRTNGQVGYVYEHALQGFSITVPSRAVAGISQNPNVAYIEEDKLVSLSAQSTPTGIQRSFAAGNTDIDIDGIDDYRVDVDVAVLDTGIDLEHPDLNVVGGANCLLTTGGGPPWARNAYCDINTSADDDHYHGTHVAGTIGALDNNVGVVGVAPGARLWAVKILDSSGSGYTSGIIAGIDWVVANGNIEVINMSIGGPGVDAAYNDAINTAREFGVVTVVAAGNESDDANDYSPAYVPSAITVSALADFDGLSAGTGSATCRNDEDDTLANFSNWGSAVDIAAPGVCIYSTFPIEQGAYSTISGTSMAAPHVAGAAALLASGAASPQNAAEVDSIRNTLLNSGNYDWTDDSGDGIKEPLLDLAYLTPGDGGGNSGGTSNIPPTANFTHSCTDLSCSFTDTSSDSDGSITVWAWDFGDSNTSTAQNPNHIYATANTYTVTLTVTDNDGVTATNSQSITVIEPAGNLAPTADFTFSTAGLTASFTDTSWDSDGVISSWFWEFGDGATSTSQSPSHAYTSADTYTVTLTVTDDNGASDTTSQSVTVTDPSGAILSVTGMSPDTMPIASTMNVTINGTGFESGANVSLSNGSGPAPVVSNVIFVDAQTITATIATKDGGPRRTRYWDVTVTNPGGSSATLDNGLTITQ